MYFCRSIQSYISQEYSRRLAYESFYQKSYLLLSLGVSDSLPPTHLSSLTDYWSHGNQCLMGLCFASIWMVWAIFKPVTFSTSILMLLKFLCIIVTFYLFLKLQFMFILFLVKDATYQCFSLGWNISRPLHFFMQPLANLFDFTICTSSNWELPSSEFFLLGKFGIVLE